ncbi:MAG TPA: DUF4097 family beta strand repeat-containing protein [Steroidobacteraceae bacterium]|nr:DUF4097 family beta strand repeat-containing protein [Steroidobacteraceae bacterium]
MIKRYFLVAALLCSSLAFAEEDVDHSLQADPKGDVDISNVAGSVSVSGWDRQVVRVTGSLGDGVERLDFTSEGKRTVIKVVLKKSTHWGDGGGADLSIRVPSGSRLDINTVSADIDVHGVTGAQRLQAVSGEVSTEVGAEEAEVKTVSGDVVLRGESKPSVLNLTTVSGNAQVSRIAGEMIATTVSGDFNLSAETIARARLRTTSGNLSLRGALVGDARVDSETISGDLSFIFKSPINAEFDVETFSGDIENCFGPRSQSKSEHGPGRELHFRQGDGKAEVRINSLSGGISLCDR